MGYYVIQAYFNDTDSVIVLSFGVSTPVSVVGDMVTTTSDTFIGMLAYYYCETFGAVCGVRKYNFVIRDLFSSQDVPEKTKAWGGRPGGDDEGV